MVNLLNPFTARRRLSATVDAVPTTDTGPPPLSNENKYVHNKDDFIFILNDVSTSTTSSSDTPVNSRLNKIVITVILLLSLLLIIRLVMFIFSSRDYVNKIVYFTIISFYIYYMHKYYIIIAFKISKFIENNLLFDL
jgi:hypothetical protein